MAAESSAAVIVVGVDGSPCGARALVWAAGYARLVGARLRLVTSWQWPTSYGAPVSFEGYQPEQQAREVLAEAAEALDLPPERVEQVTERGHAGDVLVHASKDAAALVVGTRGHSAITGTLIGSTSSYCAHHASCPVVIVR